MSLPLQAMISLQGMANNGDINEMANNGDINEMPIFGMEALPFLFNGILLFQCNFFGFASVNSEIC